MVKKEVLHQFIEKGGYNIVNFKDGRWKNTTLASRKTGLSRQTIYTILKEHPKPPPKVLPKYWEKLEESEGYKKLKQKYGKRDFWTDLERSIREGFIFLGRKDPINWNEKDFAKIWEKWYHPHYGTIDYARGTDFRRLMTILKEGTKYLASFKTKQPKPARKYWYLEEPEILALIKIIERVDLLIFVLIGILTGARRSAILSAIPEKMNWLKSRILVYEPKIKERVEKFVPETFMTLLDRYIKDFKIKPKEKLFPRVADYYNSMLKEAGKKAGLRKEITTHILKHTFAQQCKEHGVPAEVVVQQAHTELRTLEKWYSFAKEENIMKHMQGKEWNPEPFTDFADRIVAHATRRYEQIS